VLSILFAIAVGIKRQESTVQSIRGFVRARIWTRGLQTFLSEGHIR